MARTSITSLSGFFAAEGRERADRIKAETAQAVKVRSDYASSGLAPDWLTTGLAGAGAGWVFGPVGGLIGAAVTAIVNRKNKKGIIARASADQETADSLITGGEKSIASLEAAAVTDQDKFEASLMRSQFEQAVALTQNPDGNVAAQGFQALLSLPGLVSQEADEIEAAQLAREELARTQADKIFTNFQTIKDDFRVDTRTFGLERDSYKKLTAALGAESAAGDLAAIFSFMKQIDPISVVREGEFATAAAAGSVDERTRGLYNKVLTGERLTPSQRRDFQNRGTELYRISLDRYLDQESRMISEAQFAKVPNELIDTVKQQWIAPHEMQSAPDLESLRTDEEVSPARVLEPSGMAQGVTVLMNEVMNTIADVGRMGRDETVVAQDGKFYVVDAEGKRLREAEEQNAGFANLMEALGAASRAKPRAEEIAQQARVNMILRGAAEARNTRNRETNE